MTFRSIASLGNPLLNKYSLLTHALIKMAYCSHLLVGAYSLVSSFIAHLLPNHSFNHRTRNVTHAEQISLINLSGLLLQSVMLQLLFSEKVL